MYIALFYWPNLTQDTKDTLMGLSQVGNVAPIESGATDKFTRLRNIDLADLQSIPDFNVWELPVRADEVVISDHVTASQGVISSALNVLKAGAKEGVWMKENESNAVHQLQPELINEAI